MRWHVGNGRLRFQRGYWERLGFLRLHRLPIPEAPVTHSQERSIHAMQQTTGLRRCASLRGAYVAADRER